jgi:hypothetical protein
VTGESTEEIKILSLSLVVYPSRLLRCRNSNIYYVPVPANPFVGLDFGQNGAKQQAMNALGFGGGTLDGQTTVGGGDGGSLLEPSSLQRPSMQQQQQQ